MSSDKVREAFEAWCRSQGYRSSPARSGCGEYTESRFYFAWEAWMASRRAALDEVLEALRCELDRKAAVMDAGTRLGLERALDIVRAIGAKEEPK